MLSVKKLAVKSTQILKVNTIIRRIGAGVVMLGLSSFASAGQPGTIVEVAAANGSFNTLVTAIKAAGLVDTLNSKGPFTVFAPNDAAFAKIPDFVLKKLLTDKAALTKLLTYHVVPGKVMAADVKPGMVKTVEGQDIKITVKDGAVMVNDAKVVGTDVPASNGVIHVIDNVLQPE
jgi:uncharacterized surface protein with fasciclin (FAS1) repeats